VNEKIFIKNFFFDFKENKEENIVSLIKNFFKSISSLSGKRRGRQKVALIFSDQNKQLLLKYVKKVIFYLKKIEKKLKNYLITSMSSLRNNLSEH
jgi:hypothetical protein